MSRIVAAALFSLIGAPALAADLPVKAPPAPPPIFSWSGCYAGVHVGAGWINNQIDGGPFVSTVPATLLPPALLGGAVVPMSGTDFGSIRSTATLGGQAGCSYQFASHLVVGVEGDANWAGFRAVGLQSASTTATLSSGAPSVPFSATASSTGTFSATTDLTATLTGHLATLGIDFCSTERAAEPGSGTVIVFLARLLLAAVPPCISRLHPHSA
jgi:hypothetical protein